MIEVASLVLFAANLATTAAFYRAIGLELEHENHDDAPTHHMAELGSVHFAMYAAETSAGQAPDW